MKMLVESFGVRTQVAAATQMGVEAGTQPPGQNAQSFSTSNGRSLF